MEKKKAVVKIEGYEQDKGLLHLYIQDYSVRAMVLGLVGVCKTSYSGYIRVEMSPPYRARTTGELSQNNKIWLMITKIAQQTGNELSDVESACKERAIKRGYPYHLNKITGKPEPASMRTISTVEASYLIDELYAIANEYNVDLGEV